MINDIVSQVRLVGRLAIVLELPKARAAFGRSFDLAFSREGQKQDQEIAASLHSSAPTRSYKTCGNSGSQKRKNPLSRVFVKSKA